MSGSPEPDRLSVRPTEYGIETLAALARRLSPDSPHSPAATEKVARYRENYAIVLDADGPAVISALGERTPIPSEVAQVVYRVLLVAYTRSRPTRTPWLVLCDAGGRVVMSLPPLRSGGPLSVTGGAARRPTQNDRDGPPHSASWTNRW